MMHACVSEGAAAVLAVVPPGGGTEALTGIGPVIAGSGDHKDRANPACTDPLPRLRNVSAIMEVFSDRHHNGRIACSGNGLLALSETSSYGLLADHMLARPHTLDQELRGQ